MLDELQNVKKVVGLKQVTRSIDENTALKVIVALPDRTPVTLPLSFTVAIVESLEVQVFEDGVVLVVGTSVKKPFSPILSLV